MSTFLVRPSNSEKEVFRVKLTAASLLGLKLKPGDLCDISLSTNDATSIDGPTKSAIAWEASGNGMKDNIVQTSKFLQELYGFKLGDKVTISRATESLKDAETVTLVKRNISDSRHDPGIVFWEQYVKLVAKASNEYLALSQTLSFSVGPALSVFQVTGIGLENATIGKITEQSDFRVVDDQSYDPSKVAFAPKTLGGLDSEILEIQKLFRRLLRPKIPLRYQPVQGLLIYGAKGVGKTCLIEEMSQSGWASVHRWSSGMNLRFSNQPTLIIIDQLDIPPSQNASKAAIRELDQLFSAARGKPCLIVGETTHPNDIDIYLRSDGRFASEVEIPIPTALQRRKILLAMIGDDESIAESLLQEMADRTHGYVGADLKALLRRVLEIASERAESAESTNNVQANGVVGDVTWNPDTNDLDQALRQIRPSALREIFLETPNVHWDDIGGQHEIKRQLQNAVERPLKLAEQMRRLALKPKKGVLLYGPPGCSKTLLVRALAREAGLNFIAVKGAELISMYVGESERATREVFRKARAASPSIIFFDEIDAIATRTRTTSNDLNVLTTLLNEMDGFEELKNVFVVAATNKPEKIDSALMRPGRFDNIVYIGPPDFAARIEIFEKQIAKSNYKTDTSPQQDTELFATLTAGFSGAEVVAICQTAAEYALDDNRDYYTATDIQRAITETPKSITQEMLLEFQKWNAARMT